MDLIPKPDQVVSAAGNVAHRLVRGGLADLRPMPRTLVDEGPRRELFSYLPVGGAEQGDPVLLVTPLAAPALCYDLRRGCSLVEHLVDGGRPTYLVEYGEVSFRDRGLTVAPWIDDVVPTAVRRVSAHAGGRAVHVVGWSLGGTFALLTAAADPLLPIASITVLGSPLDVGQVPLVAPPRPLLDLTGGPSAVTRIYRAAEDATPAVVRWAFQLSAFQRLVTKPLALAAHLDDADYLAQVEAVDRFRAHTTAYRGRTFGQLYHRLLTGQGLVDGAFKVGKQTVRLADVTAPVLVVGGATDRIAPIAAVKPAVPLLTGSREVRFEIVPGGHLGMLTGREARTSTWPQLDAWFAEWTGTGAEPEEPEGPAVEAPAAESPAGETPAGDEPPPIGSNPERRYGSAGSRALRR